MFPNRNEHSIFHSTSSKKQLNKPITSKTLLVTNFIIARQLLEFFDNATSTEEKTHPNENTPSMNFHSLTKRWLQKLKSDPSNAIALIDAVFLSIDNGLPTRNTLKTCHNHWMDYLLNGHKKDLTIFLKKYNEIHSEISDNTPLNQLSNMDNLWIQMQLVSTLSAISICKAYELLDHIFLKHPEFVNYELPDLVTRPHYIGTPLVFTIELGDITLVKLLLNHKVNVNQHELQTAHETEQSHSMIPLLYTLYKVYFIYKKKESEDKIDTYAQLVDLLLEHGADPDLSGSLGSARKFSQSCLQEAPEEMKFIFQKVIDAPELRKDCGMKLS